MLLDRKGKKNQERYLFDYEEDPMEQGLASLAKIADAKFVHVTRQLAYVSGQLRKLMWK